MRRTNDSPPRRWPVAVLAAVLVLLGGCGIGEVDGVASGSGEDPGWSQGPDHSWAVGLAATADAIFSSDDHVQAGFVLSSPDGRERWRGLPPIPLHAPSIVAWDGRFVIAGRRCPSYRMIDGEPLCSGATGAVLVFEPADRSWTEIVDGLGADGDQLRVKALGVIDDSAIVETTWWGGRALIEVDLKERTAEALPDPPVEGYPSDSMLSGLGACVTGASVLVAAVPNEAPPGASIESATYVPGSPGRWAAGPSAELASLGVAEGEMFGAAPVCLDGGLVTVAAASTITITPERIGLGADLPGEPWVIVPVHPGGLELLWIDDQLFAGGGASGRWTPTGVTRPSVRHSVTAGDGVAVLHGQLGQLTLEVVAP